MWKELQEKIDEKNSSGSHTRVEWFSDGEYGEGKLTGINVSEDRVEFFIVDDRPEVGSFSLSSARSVIGISPQRGDDLHISSHYMGSIIILHDG